LYIQLSEIKGEFSDARTLPERSRD